MFTRQTPRFLCVVESIRLGSSSFVTIRVSSVVQKLLNLLFFQRNRGLKMANNQIPWHIIMDIVCLVLLGIADMLFYVIPIEPNHRGFFCHDQSLQKPFQSETVSTSTTILVGFCTSIPVVSTLLLF